MGFLRSGIPFIALILFFSALMGVFSGYIHTTTVFAQSGGTDGEDDSSAGGTDGADCENCIQNPLNVDSIQEFVLAIIDVVLIFLIPVITLYIMYAGFLYVTAQGNPGKLTAARNALITALIGGVIVLGAKVILEVVEGTIRSITNTPAASLEFPPHV